MCYRVVSPKRKKTSSTKSESYRKVKKSSKSNSHRNRGMKLEQMVEKHCDRYAEEGSAYIYKIPTDWNVIWGNGKIVGAFPKKKSIVDFMGSVDGKAIALETKSIQSTTSFPFSMIADHQYDFFDNWCKDSFGFYIIWFEKLNEMYIVNAMELIVWKETWDRKSIPIDFFRKNVLRIEDGNFLSDIYYDIVDII